MNHAISSATSVARSDYRAQSWCLFLRIFVYEGRVLLADRTLWLACGLLCAFLGYGLYNGLTEIRAREHTLREIGAGETERETKNLAQLRRVLAGNEIPGPFSNPADPASMGGSMGSRHAVMPYRALAPLALGQSDMAPNYYRVTNRNKSTFLYDGEMESPWHLMSGHFDAAFVVIYLLPLLILAISYNLLSAERERGTLRMLLSQPLGIGTLLLAKVAVRAVAVLGVLALTVGVVMLALRPAVWQADGSGALAWWFGLVAAYALIWFALASLVNAWGRPSASNAFTLMTLWVLLVLVAPVLLNLAVSQAYPAPSRTELATRTRLITIAGLERYATLLATDYRYLEKPQVLAPRDGKIEVAERRKAHYLMGRDTDAEIDGLLAAFERQLLAQQGLIERFALLSPAAVAHEGMSALAGTGSRRYTRFVQQVGGYHAGWKTFFEPKILDGIAMTEADLAALPRFAWQEEPVAELRAQLGGYAAQLLLPALLLALWAWRRLRRYPVV